MSWGKIRDKTTKKPLGWWRLKILCEFYYPWYIRMYYVHLDTMNRKYKLNLYGEKI